MYMFHLYVFRRHFGSSQLGRVVVGGKPPFLAEASKSFAPLSPFSLPLLEHIFLMWKLVLGLCVKFVLYWPKGFLQCSIPIAME